MTWKEWDSATLGEITPIPVSSTGQALTFPHRGEGRGVDSGSEAGMTVKGKPASVGAKRPLRERRESFKTLVGHSRQAGVRARRR